MKRLVRREDGAVVADDVRVAKTLFGRFRGLMGRARLDPGEALWLEPCNSIHMMFMRFAIDVMFLQPVPGEGLDEVLAVRSNVRPWIGMAWCLRAQTTVELAAGHCARLGIAEGDMLVLEDVA